MGNEATGSNYLPVYTHKGCCQVFLSHLADSNCGPTLYESVVPIENLEPEARFELATYSLRKSYSTNWVTPALTGQAELHRHVSLWAEYRNRTGALTLGRLCTTIILIPHLQISYTKTYFLSTPTYPITTLSTISVPKSFAESQPILVFFPEL